MYSSNWRLYHKSFKGGVKTLFRITTPAGNYITSLLKGESKHDYTLKGVTNDYITSLLKGESKHLMKQLKQKKYYITSLLKGESKLGRIGEGGNLIISQVF